MSELLVVKPRLSERVAAHDSRTCAFGERHFGARAQGVAVELVLPSKPDTSQQLLAEVLFGLLVRMDPVVTEMRLAKGHLAERMIAEAAERIPLAVSIQSDSALPAVRFGVGPCVERYVDASDWCVGFDCSAPGSRGNSPAGAFLAAVEAAKHLYVQSVGSGRAAPLAYEVWRAGVFDAWHWNWLDAGWPSPQVQLSDVAADVVVVGCGGVGAAFLWFLINTHLSGRLLLIDDDFIEWHNMNRLPYALIGHADQAAKKVLAAGDFMSGRWEVCALPRLVDHPAAMAQLDRFARSNASLISAAGGVESRRFLGRRAFARIIDAATNSDGSAQLLALEAGTSTCIDCHIVEPPLAAAKAGCGNVQLPRFAGVVPHLAAYAGVLAGIEHLRTCLGAPRLIGANTQNIFRHLDETARFATMPCTTCPARAKVAS